MMIRSMSAALADLPTEENWDTYGASVTTDKAKAVARAMTVVPSSDGGINLELHAGGSEVEIEVNAAGEVIAVYWGRATAPADNEAPHA